MWAPSVLAFDLGGVEAGPDLGLQLQRGPAGQWPRRNVEFDVVGAQFGLVRRIGDRRQHLLVAHRGLIVGVDQVAFDLHAGQRTLELETGPGQHRFEDVEAQLHLAPVFAAVRATEVGLLDLFAHNADATGSVTRAQGNRAQRRGVFARRPASPTSVPSSVVANNQPGSFEDDRIRTHHCTAGAGRSAAGRTAAAQCRLGGRRRAVLLAVVVLGVHAMRSTCIRCGRQATSQARSTPRTGCADWGSCRCGSQAACCCCSSIFYAIFVMVLISQGGDWGHHHRYMD